VGGAFPRCYLGRLRRSLAVGPRFYFRIHFPPDAVEDQHSPNPEVPEQVLSVFTHPSRAEGGRLDKRRCGAQRQEVGEGPLVQRIEEGGDPVVERWAVRLDA
jgi:hypothetical protein